MIKHNWRCVKCQGTPDLHNIRTKVIRVFNANEGKWTDYPLHGFVMESEK